MNVLMYIGRSSSRLANASACLAPDLILFSQAILRKYDRLANPRHLTENPVAVALMLQ